MADLRGAVETLLDAFDGDVPEENCSCQLHPPCGDCFEWRQKREAIAYAREALKADRSMSVPPAPEPTVVAAVDPCPQCRALTRLVCGSSACGNRPPELPPIPVNQTDEE